MRSLTWVNIVNLTAPNDWEIPEKITGITNKITRNINKTHHANSSINYRINSDLKYIENLLNDLLYKQLFIYIMMNENEKESLKKSIDEIATFVDNLKFKKRTELTSQKHPPVLSDVSPCEEKFIKYNEKFYYIEKEFEKPEEIKIKSKKHIKFFKHFKYKKMKNKDYFEKKISNLEKSLKESYQPAFYRFLFVVFTFGLGMLAIKTYQFFSNFWKGSDNEKAEKSPDKTNAIENV